MRYMIWGVFRIYGHYKKLPMQQTQLLVICRYSMHIALAYTKLRMPMPVQTINLYMMNLLVTACIVRHTTGFCFSSSSSATLLNSNVNVIATFYILYSYI